MADNSNPSLSSPKVKKRRGPFLNVFLFLATMATTWLAGAGGETLEDAIANGLVYMASIMGILLSHEMGHYLMARRNRVDASLPFFLPFPAGPIGTFGAIIAMRGRIKSRSALMEIGAAGPLAGMAVALPILLVGLSKSQIMAVPPSSSEALILGESLLYRFSEWLVVGNYPPDSAVMLHPMAWAGWIGLLVTMFNLIPIGQLDGGHIFYALWPDYHEKISRLFFRGLFVLGLSIMSYETMKAVTAGLEGWDFANAALTGSQWLVIGGLLAFFFGRKKGPGFKHPPVDNNDFSNFHRAIGFVCLLLLILTFMPVPIRPAS